VAAGTPDNAIAVWVANDSSCPITSFVPGTGKVPCAGVAVTAVMGALEAGFTQAADAVIRANAKKTMNVRLINMAFSF
jgi:hypothetical protein